jgi:GTP diphosphokinase / guanosine-3',5'-bis(diphosphate) 3'-diphosphatase
MATAKLEQAIQLATHLHAGQVDKAGKPYIEHPLRVMASVTEETEKIVAVLHDTLEDTSLTVEAIDHLFGPDVAFAVKALSKLDGEDYFSFIKRVQLNAIAVKVKLADLKDNMDLSRLEKVTDRDLLRHAKYKEALKILEAADQQ